MSRLRETWSRITPEGKFWTFYTLGVVAILLGGCLWLAS